MTPSSSPELPLREDYDWADLPLSPEDWNYLPYFAVSNVAKNTGFLMKFTTGHYNVDNGYNPNTGR